MSQGLRDKYPAAVAMAKKSRGKTDPQPEKL
jgi:hypothetical protein